MLSAGLIFHLLKVCRKEKGSSATVQPNGIQIFMSPGMCSYLPGSHNHSALCINVALQADSYFDFQAQIGIFLPYIF